MALRDVLAAASSKANSLASAASSKANTAIEAGKLNLKINSEEKKIVEFTQNIGELVLDRLDAGETCDDEIMALYDSILSARAVIDEARAELEARRQATGPVCPSCGTPLAEDANFCAHCGAKLEKPAPAEAEVAEGTVVETSEVITAEVSSVVTAEATCPDTSCTAAPSDSAPCSETQTCCCTSTDEETK